MSEANSKLQIQRYRSPNYLDFDEYLRLPTWLQDDPHRVAGMSVDTLRALLLPRPTRRYNNLNSTFVRALDAIHGDRNGLRALSRLVTRWPAPHWSPSWPEALAQVFCDVFFEPPPRALPPIGGFR